MSNEFVKKGINGELFYFDHATNRNVPAVIVGEPKPTQQWGTYTMVPSDFHYHGTAITTEEYKNDVVRQLPTIVFDGSKPVTEKIVQSSLLEIFSNLINTFEQELIAEYFKSLTMLSLKTIYGDSVMVGEDGQLTHWTNCITNANTSGNVSYATGTTIVNSIPTDVDEFDADSFLDNLDYEFDCDVRDRSSFAVQENNLIKFLKKLSHPSSPCIYLGDNYIKVAWFDMDEENAVIVYSDPKGLFYSSGKIEFEDYVPVSYDYPNIIDLDCSDEQINSIYSEIEKMETIEPQPVDDLVKRADALTRECIPGSFTVKNMQSISNSLDLNPKLFVPNFLIGDTQYKTFFINAAISNPDIYKKEPVKITNNEALKPCDNYNAIGIANRMGEW